MVNFALPPTTAGCGGATALAGGADRIPITVSTVAGQVSEMVNVCIAGRGPYPVRPRFGGGRVDHRPRGWPPSCSWPTTGRPPSSVAWGAPGGPSRSKVASWSVAGVPLAPQEVTAATLPDFGGAGQAVGLLGSDVLSRFGAVRLDFTAQTLTFGGAEGPVPHDNAEDVHGPTGPAPSAVLTQGEAGTTVPLTVVLTPGDVALDVRSRFGDGPARTFVVDTGSSQIGRGQVVGQECASGLHRSGVSANPRCARSLRRPWCTAGRGRFPA